MTGSIRLASISGIRVYVHVTFFLLLGWVAFENLVRGRSAVSTLGAIGLVTAIFLCVLLHEFGHALAARHFGIRTRSITLLPIGGLARLERTPEEPRQELWVALAGPAVNLVIAGLLALVMLVAGQSPIPRHMGEASFLQWLFLGNLILFLFNLIPAFPMDGGRILRALLARRHDYLSATRAAATIGQVLALVMGLAGAILLGAPVLIFVALFVWIGAVQERSLARLRGEIIGVPVGRAMRTQFLSLGPGDTLGDVIRITLKSKQRDYPVVDDGYVVGVLLQDDLLSALTEPRREATVSELMTRDFGTADPCDTLETVYERLQGSRCRTMPVVTRNGILVGTLSLDHINQFVTRQRAAAKDPKLGESVPEPVGR